MNVTNAATAPLRLLKSATQEKPPLNITAGGFSLSDPDRWARNTAARFIVAEEGTVRNDAGNHITYDDLDGKPVYSLAEWRKKRRKGTLTIGHGHTSRRLKPGTEWSDKEAQIQFKIDFDAAEARMRKALKGGIEIPAAAYIGIMDIYYNVGSAGAGLRKIINRGQWDRLPSKLLEYVNSGGVVVQGLVDRRRRAVNMLEASTPEAAETFIKGISVTPGPSAGITQDKQPKSLFGQIWAYVLLGLGGLWEWMTSATVQIWELAVALFILIPPEVASQMLGISVIGLLFWAVVKTAHHYKGGD